MCACVKDISSCQLSKPIKGGEAHELGSVDALASPNDLVNTARQWALDIYMNLGGYGSKAFLGCERGLGILSSSTHILAGLK